MSQQGSNATFRVGGTARQAGGNWTGRFENPEGLNAWHSMYGSRLEPGDTVTVGDAILKWNGSAYKVIDGDFVDGPTANAWTAKFSPALAANSTATIAGVPSVYQPGVGWVSQKTEAILRQILATANVATRSLAVVSGVATWAEGVGPSPWRVPDAPFMTRTGVAPESLLTANFWANCKVVAPYSNGSTYMDPVSSQAQRVHVYKFSTDAQAITIPLQGSHNSTHGVTVIVDGDIVFSGITTKAGGSTAYGFSFFNLTFAKSGMHVVTIVMDGTYSCDGIYFGAPIPATAEGLYTCKASPSNAPTMAISSDSFGAGTGGLIPPTSCASQAALLLGIDPLVIANGGTGYVVNGPSTNWPTHAPSDVLNHDADSYLMLLGVNDASQPVATITAKVSESLALIRATSQDAPIFVCGPWNPRTAVPSTVRDAIFAGCAGFSGVYLIDNYVSGWQTGDGRAVYFTGALVGATSATMTTNWAGSTGTYTLRFSDGSLKTVTLTNGSASVSWTGAVTATATAGAYTVAGNSTLYVGPDGTHPPQVGHDYLAARIADGVVTACRSALGLA